MNRRTETSDFQHALNLLYTIVLNVYSISHVLTFRILTRPSRTSLGENERILPVRRTFLALR